MKQQIRVNWVLCLSTVLLVCGMTLPAFAESPIEAFNERMQPMEAYIVQNAGDPREQAAAYRNLEVALNHELGRAFNMVMQRTPDESMQDMAQSQHEWRAHRDREFGWMEKAHGNKASQMLTMLQLRNLMLNGRVIQLYSYLDTLPDPNEAAKVAAKAAANNELRVARIRGFTLGDDACFLDMVDDKRKHFTEVAAPGFCQREKELLDKRVGLVYQLGVVSGATCAVEHVDCQENNMLVLVKDVKKLARPRK